MTRPSNRLRILRLLLKSGDLSHRKVKRELSLSDETYYKLRAELVADGLVEKTEGQRGGGGVRLTSKGKQEALSPGNPKEEGPSSGSGFLISSEGHVLTNAHVIAGSRRIQVVYGSEISLAHVLAADENNDLALLKTNLKASKLPAFRSDPKLGECVAVFGFPMPGIIARTGNITEGLIAALASGDDTGKFQLSAQIQPGNSGGPVLDNAGNVVGVVVSGLSDAYFLKARNHVPQNVNFAIKAAVALNFLQANGVQPSILTKNDLVLPWSEVAESAKAFSVLIECNTPVLSEPVSPVDLTTCARSRGGPMMKLQSKVQEMFDESNGRVEVTADEEKGTSVFSSKTTVKNQPHRLYVETDENIETLKVFIYPPITVPDKSRLEVIFLMNFINRATGAGKLTLDTVDGEIQFRHFVDVEGVEPSVVMIRNMISAGCSVFENWFDELAEVAFAGVKAQTVIDRVIAEAEK